MRTHPLVSAFERIVLALRTVTLAAQPGECWIWPMAKCNKGYGCVSVAGKTRRVHIVAWEMARGRAVKPGYTLDHLDCVSRACWRPSHMQEVTRAVNTARGNRRNPRSTVKATAAAAEKRRHFSFKCDGSVRADPELPAIVPLVDVGESCNLCDDPECDGEHAG